MLFPQGQETLGGTGFGWNWFWMELVLSRNGLEQEWSWAELVLNDLLHNSESQITNCQFPLVFIHTQWYSGINLNTDRSVYFF